MARSPKLRRAPGVLTTLEESPSTDRSRSGAAHILFLDFDGVLHPNLCAPSEWFSRIHILEEALDGLADVRIVISSSWRLQHSYAVLRRRFPERLRHLLIGTTGDAHVGARARYHEIDRWLKSYAPGVDSGGWRSLDDAAFDFPPNCPQLILCDGAVGISAREVAALRGWLGGAGSGHRGNA